MDKQTICDIIDNFAKKDMVFTNEQDFQFELAIALKNEPDVESVKLEALSLTTPWSNVKKNADNKEKLSKATKEYTDILVKTKEEYVAIELKYKTPYKICYYQTNNGDVVTMSQGAYDISAYDYIKDIERLENINVRYFCNEIKISKGYAVLLTNDKNYRYNDFSKSKIWKNYSLAEKIKKLPSGSLMFNANKQTYKTTRRTFSAIRLKGVYRLEWKNYDLPNYQEYEDKTNSCNPGFSYLVVEVQP